MEIDKDYLSDLLRETLRKHAAENVHQNGNLTDKTKIKVGLFGLLGVCLTIIGATIGGTWAFQTYITTWKESDAKAFNAIAEEMKDTKNAVAYKWSHEQMVAWAQQLDKANRDKNLVVPDIPPVTAPASASPSVIVPEQ